MVSGNTGSNAALFDIKDETSVDFTALSAEEQRVVAERLLKMRESQWKPFWCPDKNCGGDPHAAKGPLGEMLFVSQADKAGPNGEPVADLYGSANGVSAPRPVLDPTKIAPGEEYLGRIILDPTWAHNHARVDQRLPSWKKPWNLFIMSGRGTGKTRTGIEFVTLHARKGLDGAILGRRGTELVNTHVKEILKHAHPEFTPIHWASKDILEWPNGAITYLFSAEKPENIRSVNLSYYWIDEAAFMEFIVSAHTNLKLATRIEDADNPKHVLITSTPTSTPWVMEREEDPEYEIRRVSTYANRANLGVSYLADLVRDLEGTRTGRQELHGEVLRDVEGAMWNDDMFRHMKVTDAAAFVELCESMDDIVVAVDPAGTANKRSDQTGIIAVGVQHSDEDGNRLAVSRFFTLADGTLKGSPDAWAERVYDVARITRARRIVAEKNFGADMVLNNLRQFAKAYPEKALTVDGDPMADMLEEADARQSKETRAETTVGKYEQGRVTHVPNPTAYGDLSVLEKEQTTWVPRSRGGKQPSPNRIDAIVWAIRALEKAIRYDTSMATSREVAARTRPVTPTWTGGVAPVMPAARDVLKPEPTISAPVAPLAPVKRVISQPKTKVWPSKPKRPAGVHKM